MKGLIILLLLLPTVSLSQTHRKVDVECRSLFPFDPLTDRYVSGSLSQVAEYVKQWRAVDSIDLNIHYNPLIGFRIYEQLVDSTLSKRVFDYFTPYQVVDSLTKPVDFNQMPHSNEFSEFFSDDIQNIKRFFSTPIAKSSDTLKVDDTYYGMSTFASLFHQFQLEVTGAEVSLFAPPAERGYFTGNIYIKDVYNLLRFDNQLVTFVLTGKQIYDYLQNVYSKRYYKVISENSDLVRWKTPYYLNISAAGVSFTYNVTKSKIENWSLKLDKKYTIVANSFIAKEFVQEANYGDYRINFIKWLLNMDDIKPTIYEDWKLIPERWVKTITLRESSYRLLHK